jgi:protein gp37
MKYWNACLRITHGCTPISGGCAFCWSAAETYVRQYNPLVRKQYLGLLERPPKGFAPRFNGQVRVHAENIYKIMQLSKPHVYQVWNDLFHDAVPTSVIEEVAALARLKKTSTFIVLTKRHARLMLLSKTIVFPPNMYVGVSVSGGYDDVARLKELEATDAPAKCISYEPIIAPVDFSQIVDDPALKVIFAGGETGPKQHIRDCPEDAVWNVMQECVKSNVLFFFKSWGDRRGGRILDGRTWDELPWVL